MITNIVDQPTPINFFNRAGSWEIIIKIIIINNNNNNFFIIKNYAMTVLFLNNNNPFCMQYFCCHCRLADESPLCGPCHISYSNSKSPYPVSLTSCSVCKLALSYNVIVK